MADVTSLRDADADADADADVELVGEKGLRTGAPDRENSVAIDSLVRSILPAGHPQRWGTVEIRIVEVAARARGRGALSS